MSGPQSPGETRLVNLSGLECGKVADRLRSSPDPSVAALAVRFDRAAEAPPLRGYTTPGRDHRAQRLAEVSWREQEMGG